MNKMIKAARKNVVRVAGVSALALASSSVLAAVDISADITAAKSDVATNGGLIIGVIVAIAAIAWIRRLLK